MNKPPSKTQPTPGQPHFHINQRELSRRRHARSLMTVCLAFTDLFSLSLAFGLASLLGPGEASRVSSISLSALQIAVILMLFLLFYTFAGLYPAVGLSPVDELRILSRATLVNFLLLYFYLFLSQTLNLSPVFLLAALVFSLVVTQLGRWGVRIVARYFGFWGEPVVLFGAGKESAYIAAYIKDSIRLGIRPVVTVDGYWSPDDEFAQALQATGIRTAMLVIDEMSDEQKDCIIRQRMYPFHRLILIPSLEWVYSLGVATYDLEGILGLEVRQNLLNPRERLLKRVLDLTIAALGGLAILPFGLLIAALIRLDSPGKIFYRQERIGRNGTPFRILKFRTMVANADQCMQEYFAANPGMKAEWEANQKIKNDPRVTRVGAILRKLSLDELPQLWNVLTGEMSVVGPRPIICNHHGADMKHVFTKFEPVRPGITGLWQVSGRSDTSYDERLRYDEYYIRNWSIWLDIYILLRTVYVVFAQRGAY